jgi:hypothetical protein
MIYVYNFEIIIKFILFFNHHDIINDKLNNYFILKIYYLLTRKIRTIINQNGIINFNIYKI